MTVAPRGHWVSPVLAALIAVGAVASIGVLIQQLIGEGPFGWHLERARTWQGGLEVLALATLLALVAGAVRAPRWRAVLLLALAGLYLRRHYVDLPMLADLACFEILIGLGAFAARLCGLPRAGEVRAYLYLAVAGIVLWSLGAWLLSASGSGSLRSLRIYTLLLAVPASFGRQTPFCLFLWRRFASLAPAQRAYVAALTAWFLCLAARTNVVRGFDSWWYGLRGDYVLVAGGSVFKPLDLVAPVYYYPKLYELLLIPVSGLGDTSVIQGVSLLVLVLFALACMELLKAFALGFRTRVLLVAACVTLPAIANIAIMPKPDIFMAFVLLLATAEAVRVAREGSATACSWMLTGCALAFSSKLSAPPFIVAIVIASFILWLRNGRPRLHERGPEPRFAVSVAVAAFAVAALVTARTWLLTGVPLVGPQPVVEIFTTLGFTPKPPAGVLGAGPAIDWSDLPVLLVDQLFRPQRLDHMVISWIGNVWLYLFAIALLARFLVGEPAPDRPRVPVIWTVLMLTGLALLLTFRTMTRGGDGNYFVLPLALAILAGGYLALTRLPSGMPKRLLVAMLPLFILFQASYSFVSAGWSPGTRPFDLDFTRGVRDLRGENRRVFEYAGIYGIAEYLRAVHGIPRGIGYVADEPAFRLPATFETMKFYGYWYSQALESPDAFLDMLRTCRIDYLVLPKPGNTSVDEEVADSVAEAAERLGARPEVHVIEDRRYVLYDLAALHAKERAAP